MITLVVFLGNPGSRYRQTRHNIAWMLCDLVSSSLGLAWKEKFKGRYAQLKLEERSMTLLTPQVYMNRSGESVAACAGFFKMRPDEILVVHDDMELKFGHIEIKSGGGLAGHNGLRSIASALGTNAFNRFRLGISRPERGDAHAHVLGTFSEDEQAVLSTYLAGVASILDRIIHQGIDSMPLQDRKTDLLSS